MKYYIDVLKKYAVFSGRARRKEYWYFALFNMIITYTLMFVDFALLNDGNLQEIGMLQTVYSLGVMVPGLAAAVRRIHDTGRSGLYILIPFYNLYLLIKNGDIGVNEYGADPKDETGMESEALDSYLVK